MNQKQIIGSIMAATGKTVCDVAKENQLTHMMMYRVINGESVNSDTRELISKIIAKPINKIWPEMAKEERK